MNPFIKFDQWYKQAVSCDLIKEPTAFTLSTVVDNKPSSRVVLLKDYGESFTFFTNYNSRKANEISQNNNVSMCFYWFGIDKQVRIEGKAYKIDEIKSDEYFNSRPRMSKIGAWASIQSTSFEDSEFKDRLNHFESKFKDKDVPRPEFWGGFEVKPSSIEFWNEGEFRIHERFKYDLSNNWNEKKLYP